MKHIAFLIGLALPLHAMAISESDFQKCVQIKDLTLSIAAQADKGVPRADLKSRVSAGAHQMVDWVYDFRGAFTSQQMAERQMSTCVKHFSRR